MYQAEESRYDKMSYKRCGNSGILLPRVSLGMWQNFGAEKPLPEQKEIIFRAFDLGITHFDLANNYGAPNIGMAEENFGKIFCPFRRGKPSNFLPPFFEGRADFGCF